MPSVIKLAIQPMMDIEKQALRQFLRKQSRAQIPGTLDDIVANDFSSKKLRCFYVDF